MDRLMLRMYFDDDSGELGQVKESEAFAKEDLLLRTDVLRDALFHIADMYNDAVERYVGSLEWPEGTSEDYKDQVLKFAQLLKAKVVMPEVKLEDTILPATVLDKSGSSILEHVTKRKAKVVSLLEKRQKLEKEREKE